MRPIGRAHRVLNIAASLPPFCRLRKRALGEYVNGLNYLHPAEGSARPRFALGGEHFGYDTSMAKATTIRFTSFPRTEPPPQFIGSVMEVFRQNESLIGTEGLSKGLTSDTVLAAIRGQLVALGFAVEGGKLKEHLIERPVFYGENGNPSLRYRIDAYHAEWRCGLEVEAGRAWMGNAIYRDLILAMVMVQVDHLCLAVPNIYRYKGAASKDYQSTVAVADALFGHTRVRIPYGLTVIGY